MLLGLPTGFLFGSTAGLVMVLGFGFSTTFFSIGFLGGFAAGSGSFFLRAFFALDNIAFSFFLGFSSSRNSLTVVPSSFPVRKIALSSDTTSFRAFSTSSLFKSSTSFPLGALAT